MDNEERPPHKKQRPKRSQGNVVLEKNGAPSNLAHEFQHSGPANDGERKFTVTLCLRDHPHLMAKRQKLAGQKVRRRFNPSRTWKKMVRSEQNFHGTE
jgi:hypothetical protein